VKSRWILTGTPGYQIFEPPSSSWPRSHRRRRGPLADQLGKEGNTAPAKTGRVSSDVALFGQGLDVHKHTAMDEMNQCVGHWGPIRLWEKIKTVPGGTS